MAITLDGTTGITTPGLTNTGTETIVNLTTTGNTILGDASTDTLNVGNGGLVKDASGNVGIGVTPSAWVTYKAIEIGVIGSSLWSSASIGDIRVSGNMYYSGGYKYAGSNLASMYQQASGIHSWYNAPSGTAGNAITFTEAMRIDASGNLGIGNVNPVAKLDIYRTSVGTYFLGGSDNVGRQLAIKSSTTSNDGDTHTFDAQSGSGVLAFATTSTERMRIDSSGNLLVGGTSAGDKLSSFTNTKSSACLAQGTYITGGVLFASTYSASSSNNATVDAFLFRNSAGSTIGSAGLAGHFYVRVTGGSGANQYCAVYTIITAGNGTSSATLALVNTAIVRGTSPVSIVGIAADGVGGAIKLRITYINNGGVVDFGSSVVSFIGTTI
jgi:hypothetical protein